MTNPRPNKIIAAFAALSLVFLQVVPAGWSATPLVDDLQGRGVSDSATALTKPVSETQAQSPANPQPANSRNTSIDFMLQGNSAVISPSAGSEENTANATKPEPVELGEVIKPEVKDPVLDQPDVVKPEVKDPILDKPDPVERPVVYPPAIQEYLDALQAVFGPQGFQVTVSIIKRRPPVYVFSINDIKDNGTPQGTLQSITFNASLNPKNGALQINTASLNAQYYGVTLDQKQVQSLLSVFYRPIRISNTTSVNAAQLALARAMGEMAKVQIRKTESDGTIHYNYQGYVWTLKPGARVPIKGYPVAVQDHIETLQAQLGEGFKVGATRLRDGTYQITVVDTKMYPAVMPDPKTGLLQQMTYRIDAKGVIREGSLKATYYNVAGVDANILFEALKTMKVGNPERGKIVSDIEALKRMTVANVLDVDTDGTIHFQFEGNYYKTHRDETGKVIVEQDAPPAVRDYVEQLQNQLGSGFHVNLVISTQYVKCLRGPCPPVMRYTVVVEDAKVYAQAPTTGLQSMSYRISADGKIIDSTVSATYYSANGNLKVDGTLLYQGLLQITSDPVYLMATGIHIRKVDENGAIYFEHKNYVWKVSRDETGAVKLEQGLPVPVQDLVDQLTAEMPGYSVLVKPYYDRRPIYCKTGDCGRPGVLYYSVSIIYSGAEGLETGDLSSMRLQVSAKGEILQVMSAEYNGIGKVDAALLFGALMKLQIGCTADAKVCITVMPNPVQAIIDMGHIQITESQPTFIRFIKDGVNYYATRDASGQIIVKKEIPPAVQSYVDQLQQAMGQSYEVSAVLQADGTYLVTVKDLAVYKTTPYGKLQNMSFILDSKGNLKVDSIRVSFYSSLAKCIGPIDRCSTNVDGQLLFEGLRTLAVKNGVPVDIQAFGLMSQITISSVDKNGTIYFSKDGVNYKCYRDANGQAIVENQIPPAVQEYINTLQELLGPGGMGHYNVSWSRGSPYQISIYFQTHPDCSPSGPCPQVIMIPSEGQITHLDFVITDDGKMDPATLQGWYFRNGQEVRMDAQLLFDGVSQLIYTVPEANQGQAVLVAMTKVTINSILYPENVGREYPSVIYYFSYEGVPYKLYRTNDGKVVLERQPVTVELTREEMIAAIEASDLPADQKELALKSVKYAPEGTKFTQTTDENGDVSYQWDYPEMMLPDDVYADAMANLSPEEILQLNAAMLDVGPNTQYSIQIGLHGEKSWVWTSADGKTTYVLTHAKETFETPDGGQQTFERWSFEARIPLTADQVALQGEGLAPEVRNELIAMLNEAIAQGAEITKSISGQYTNYSWAGVYEYHPVTYQIGVENGHLSYSIQWRLEDEGVIVIDGTYFRPVTQDDIAIVINSSLSGTDRDLALAALSAMPAGAVYYKVTDETGNVLGYQCELQPLDPTKVQQLWIPEDAGAPVASQVEVYAQGQKISEMKSFVLGPTGPAITFSLMAPPAQPIQAEIVRILDLHTGLPTCEILYDAEGRPVQVTHYQYQNILPPEVLQAAQTSLSQPELDQLYQAMLDVGPNTVYTYQESENGEERSWSWTSGSDPAKTYTLSQSVAAIQNPDGTISVISVWHFSMMVKLPMPEIIHYLNPQLTPEAQVQLDAALLDMTNPTAWTLEFDEANNVTSWSWVSASEEGKVYTLSRQGDQWFFMTQQKLPIQAIIDYYDPQLSPEAEAQLNAAVQDMTHPTAWEFTNNETEGVLSWSWVSASNPKTTYVLRQGKIRLWNSDGTIEELIVWDFITETKVPIEEARAYAQEIPDIEARQQFLYVLAQAEASGVTEVLKVTNGNDITYTWKDPQLETRTYNVYIGPNGQVNYSIQERITDPTQLIAEAEALLNQANAQLAQAADLTGQANSVTQQAERYQIQAASLLNQAEQTHVYVEDFENEISSAIVAMQGQAQQLQTGAQAMMDQAEALLAEARTSPNPGPLQSQAANLYNQANHDLAQAADLMNQSQQLKAEADRRIEQLMAQVNDLNHHADDLIDESQALAKQAEQLQAQAALLTDQAHQNQARAEDLLAQAQVLMDRETYSVNH